MADQNISIKIGLDTSQFNNSVKGMAAELKALSKIDLTLLSPADSKAVIARMGDLKDSIKDVKKEIDNADPGQFFQSFSTLAGPAVAAISGIAVGMEMFGAKTEEVEKVQRKLMAVISLISTLQTIADANKLKGLMKQIPLQAMELKNRITNALLIKQEVVATTADIAMKNVQQASIVKLTLLQKLWNKAVLANPIMLMVAGITALVGAIILLTKVFGKQNEEVKESEKAMDGLIIKNEELRKSYNESLKAFKDRQLELKKIYGEIDLFTYNYQKIQDDTEFAIKTIGDTAQLEIEKLKQKKLGSLDFIQTLANAYEMAQRNKGGTLGDYWKAEYERGLKILGEEDKKALEILKDAQLKKNIVIHDGEGKIKILRAETATASEEELKRLRFDALTDEKKRMKQEYDNQVENYRKLYSSQQNYQDLVNQLTANYNAKVKAYDDKILADKLKLTKDNYDKLIQATLDAEEKLKEAKGESDGMSKLEAQYIKDLEAQKAFHEKNLTSEEDFLKAKAELDKTYAMNQQIFTLNAEKDKLEKLNEWRKTYIEKTLEEQRQMEIDAMEKLGKETGASVEEIAKARSDIEKKYIVDTFDYRKEMGVVSLAEEEQRELDAIDKKLLNEEEYRKARQNIIDKYDQMERDNNQKKMDTLNLMNEAALGALQIISDQQQANNDAEYERMNQLYDEKKAKFDEQLEYGLLSQAEYDARMEDMEKKRAEEERKLRIKAARQEKMMGLFQIAINTAMAIMKAYAQLGPIGGTAALPFLIGAGAVQAAVVAAKPIPAFADGGTMKKSGTAIVGEKGPELVQLPAGSQVISNKTLSSLTNRNSSLSSLTNRNSSSTANSFGGSSIFNSENKSLSNLSSTNRVYNPVSDISSVNNYGVSYAQMIEFVDVAFQKYDQKDIVLKVTELDRKQNEYKNIKINSEVQ